MWHEARKQEKKIRGMIVDYRRRAERRRDFYEKFKADPTQFLQLHGRSCKIHLDSAIAAAGDASSIMMPWQGCQDLLIDRFDARAHMDYIKENPPPPQDETLSYDERVLNYERYRILVQNEYLGVEEEKFLHQIYLEEQFGPIALKQTHDGEKEKEKRRKGAAIGFNYDDSSVPASSSKSEAVDDNESNSDNSELDFDLCLDLSEVDTASAHELNNCSQNFGLVGNDFYSFLTNDVEEQESLRLAKEEEEEKAMYSGRKARRERQAFRERRLQGRVMSPPSYAARQSPVYDKYNKHSKSRSRSVTPDNAGAITYITSFGEEENVGTNTAKKQVNHLQSQSKSPPRKLLKPSPNTSRRSRSGSYDSQRRSRQYSPTRGPDRRGTNARENRDNIRSNRRWSRSRSRSRGRYNRRSRSSSLSRFSHRRSRSWSRDRRRSRSRSRNRRNHSRSRSRSRSRQRTNNSPATKKSAYPASSERMETAPVVPRYYGRNRKSSSSSLEVSSSDETQVSASSSIKNNERPGGRRGVGCSRSDSKPAVKYQPRETPQEKMKRRMQALLNKQFKQDKRLEREKAEQLERDRLDRAAELRDIAIKIRRRERYLRHRDDDDDDQNSRDSRSPSSRSPRSPRPSRGSRSPRPPRGSRSPRPSRSSHSPRNSRSPVSRSPRSSRKSRSPKSPPPRSRRSRSRSSSPSHSRRSHVSKRRSPPKKSLVDY